MEKELYDKLMKVLYQKGIEEATNKESWEKFYNTFKAEDKFQLLYTIIDIDCLAKSQKNYGEADKVLTYESKERTDNDFRTILEGLLLLKNGYKFLKHIKNINSIVESAKPHAKDKDKWIEFCEEYHSNNKFDVLYAIVNLDNIASTDNEIYANTKSALKTEKENLKNKSDYDAVLDGLRLFKNGNKFVRFMNDHKNDNPFNKRRNGKTLGF